MFFNKRGVVGVGIRMGSYFFFDTLLVIIRKRERDDVLLENMFFIKVDKINRISFLFVMVLKVSLIMLFGVGIFGFYWGSMYGILVCIFKFK